MRPKASRSAMPSAWASMVGRPRLSGKFGKGGSPRAAGRRRAGELGAGRGGKRNVELRPNPAYDPTWTNSKGRCSRAKHADTGKSGGTIYGLPRIIRTDNGAPFASSQALGRLSQLSVWWIRLGILPERIQPGCPHQNGRHERLHGTLKREATIPPAGSRFAQQYRFTRFRHEYNQERPHEALQQQTPVEFYQASPRPFPRKLPPLHYPAHWEVRLVSGNGGIRWKTHRVAVTHALRQQPIGLEPIDDGVWEVWFGPLRLGRMDERQLTITDRSSKTVDRKL